LLSSELAERDRCALVSGGVAVRPNSDPSLLGQKRAHRGRLVVAVLDREHATNGEMRRRTVDDRAQ
jgi:hypothetical protein